MKLKIIDVRLAVLDDGRGEQVTPELIESKFDNIVGVAALVNAGTGHMLPVMDTARIIHSWGTPGEWSRITEALKTGEATEWQVS